MYDQIFIGTSIPMLFYIYFNKNNKILVINKDNFLGGSWHTITNEYCKDFDTAGHFIVIRNKKNLNKIYKLFNSLNIKLCKQNPFILNDNYKFIYESTILYPKNGWDKIIKFLIIKIGKSNIFLNTEVLNIHLKEDINIKIKKNNIITNIVSKNIIIPSYINLDSIQINNQIINLNYNYCNTYHIIFFCKIVENGIYNNSFHGFYKGDLIFDRLTCVCNKDKMNDIENVNQLFIFRISRNYKDKITKMTHNEIIIELNNFLNKLNIKFKKLIIKDFKIYKYSFFYRQNDISNLINIINEKSNNKIKLINTTDLGSLIENLI